MDTTPYHGSGGPALGAAFALVGVGVGLVLLGVAALARRHPQVRVVLHPLNLAILILQLTDGATTWVGVTNPFDLGLPPYEEQVFLSRVLIDTFGGGLYFVFKGILALVIITALRMAYNAAESQRERLTTTAMQLVIILVALVPVINNVNNFLRVA